MGKPKSDIDDEVKQAFSKMSKYDIEAVMEMLRKAKEKQSRRTTQAPACKFEVEVTTETVCSTCGHTSTTKHFVLSNQDESIRRESSVRVCGSCPDWLIRQEKSSLIDMLIKELRRA